MKYVSNRNITVASVSGRSVEFVKNEPTYAPPVMHAELISHGIVPEDNIEEEEKSEGPVEPTVPAEREAAFFAVYEAMVLRNDRNDFTAAGTPHAAAVQRDLGWKNSINAKERDATWGKFQQAKA